MALTKQHPPRSIVLKRAARKLLIATGVRVEFRLKVSKRARADAAEVQALESDLAKLNDLPRLTDLANDEAGEMKVWNAAGVREYLADDRILLFHDVLSATKAAGVTFTGKNVADVGSGTGYMLRL